MNLSLGLVWNSDKAIRGIDRGRPSRTPAPKAARVGASRAIFCRECQRQQVVARAGEGGRTSSGNRFEDAYIKETLAELQANIDDADAQIIAHCSELLLLNGALDVWTAPVTMKKGRAAVVLHVLCRVEQQMEMIDSILRNTTSIGVRCHQVDRYSLSRKFEQIQTKYGPVKIKVAGVANEEYNARPEYEDLKELSRIHQVPLKTILQEAMEAYRKKHDNQAEF